MATANKLAEEAELDLVEIAPTATPPVCRVMDYGKYRYQLNKKAQEGPDGLLAGLAPEIARPEAGIVDLHLYTFNAVDTFEAWRRAYLERLRTGVAIPA